MALFRLLEQRCGLFAGCGVGRCAQVAESRFGYPITCFCGRIELLNGLLRKSFRPLVSGDGS